MYSKHMGFSLHPQGSLPALLPLHGQLPLSAALHQITDPDNLRSCPIIRPFQEAVGYKLYPVPYARYKAACIHYPRSYTPAVTDTVGK